MAQFIYPPSSSSLASGAATEAEQQLQTAELQAINTNTADVATETTLSSLNSKVTAVNTSAVVISSSALPTGASTSALQTTGNTSLATIAGAVSGTEMQVDVLTLPAITATDLDIRDLSSATDSVTVVATNLDIRDLSSASDSISSVQSGTWNINNISGTINLPTGAATSANQTTTNGHLATLAGTVSGTEVQVDVLTLPAITATDLDIRDLNSATDSVTVVATNLDIRDLSSTSDSIAAVQSGTWNINNISGTISLPTGASTAANQTTANSSLSSIDGKIPANLTVTSTRLLVDGSGVTQPISAASLPLPTGAATSANQTTANSSLANIEADIDALNARVAGSLTAVTHDYLSLTYVPSGNGVGEISTVVYKTGGSGGTTVATLTLAYDSSNRLTSVTRS